MSDLVGNSIDSFSRIVTVRIIQGTVLIKMFYHYSIRWGIALLYFICHLSAKSCQDGIITTVPEKATSTLPLGLCEKRWSASVHNQLTNHLITGQQLRRCPSLPSIHINLARQTVCLSCLLGR